MRSILAFLSKSGYRKEHLDAQCAKLKIGCRIESISETRFATVYWTAASVQCCLPTFSAIVDNQDLWIDLSVHQILLHFHCISLTLPPGPKWSPCRGVQWCPLVLYCADQDYNSPGTYCKSHSMFRISTYNMCWCLPIFPCNCGSAGSSIFQEQH